MHYLSTFGIEFEKSYCHIWNQYPRICLTEKFPKEKQISLKLGPKMLYMGILELEFLNQNIVIFEISTLKFFWLQNFAKKEKCLNLGPTMPYLGTFEQKIWKKTLSCWIKSAPSHLHDWKILQKPKMQKFGTKYSLIGYFCARISKKYYHIWNQLPRTCLIAKFCKKKKSLDLGLKMPYLGIFVLEF